MYYWIKTRNGWFIATRETDHWTIVNANIPQTVQPAAVLESFAIPSPAELDVHLYERIDKLVDDTEETLTNHYWGTCFALPMVREAFAMLRASARKFETAEYFRARETAGGL